MTSGRFREAKTAAVGGIEGGMNSQAFPDGIPAPFQNKNARLKASPKIPLAFITLSPSEHGWRF